MVHALERSSTACSLTLHLRHALLQPRHQQLLLLRRLLRLLLLLLLLALLLLWLLGATAAAGGPGCLLLRKVQLELCCEALELDQQLALLRQVHSAVTHDLTQRCTGIIALHRIDQPCDAVGCEEVRQLCIAC